MMENGEGYGNMGSQGCRFTVFLYGGVLLKIDKKKLMTHYLRVGTVNAWMGGGGQDS